MFPQHHSQRFHIAIVGNVGTGKSTLARLIQQRIGGVLYLEEPEDYVLLRQFFTDPCAWGFASELQFLITKIAQQAQIHDRGQLAIQEMDEETTYAIWIPTLCAMGYITVAEAALLNQVHTLLRATPIATPDMRVYLRASVPTALARIRKRGRDYEELDANFIRLITLLGTHITQFAGDVSGPLIVVDTEAVNFTAPSRLLDGVLDDICERVPC